MIDLDTEICVCNSLTVKDIAECIKENNLNSLEKILTNDICPMGDKCESCTNEGFHNDGMNIPLVLSMVQQKKL